MIIHEKLVHKFISVLLLYTHAKILKITILLSNINSILLNLKHTNKTLIECMNNDKHSQI